MKFHFHPLVKPIADQEEKLKRLYQEGLPASEILKTRTLYTDQLVKRIFKNLPPSFCSQHICVVATGSYGSFELSRYSDLDLIFLHNNLKKNVLKNLYAAFICPFFTTGIKVGIHYRNILKPLEEGVFNLHEKTVSFWARPICGNLELFQKWKDLLKNYWMDPNHFQKFLRVFRRDIENHLKKSRLRTPQPDVKKGYGGLRDYHFLRWTGHIIGKQWTQLMDEKTTERLQTATEFLWMLRDTMHLLEGRCEDRLTNKMQNRLSKQTGLEKRLMMALYFEQTEEIRRTCIPTAKSWLELKRDS